MTGALTPLTPREFAERALVGTLLWQPGRITDIAAWLDADDFRTPANGAVFRHLRDIVMQAGAQVEWGTTPRSTDAQGALRVVEGIAESVRDMRQHPARWEEMDLDAERHVRADTVAGYVAQYPGLLQRLDADDRAEIDAVLPSASVNPYTVPAVDPVSLFERLSGSGEPGDRSITAPFLHTLMAIAPATSVAQPEVYAQMVLEASIRRQVQRAGMRVAQANETTSELAGLLAAVETAVNQVDAARQRWDAITNYRTSPGILEQLRESLRSEPQRVDPNTLRSRLDLAAPMPQAREVTTAEETVLAAVLIRPETLAGLADRLSPDDFADQQLGIAFQAAIEVQASSRATGRRVDPVTVAWEQQRHAAAHGQGAPVERLVRIVERGPIGDVRFAAEVVMRARLARLTADAAQAAQRAAQHPGRQPADVLHTTRLAYDAVRATAARMSGGPENASSFTIERRSGEPAARSHVASGRSSAQVIQLRQRATTLRSTITGENDVRSRHGALVQHAPVEPDRSADKGDDREAEPEP